MPVISNFELDAFQSLSDEMKSLARKMDDLLADMRKPADDEADNAPARIQDDEEV
jgi:ElaB/YqjD/DUF883 family membrane-anchored ribosome-binding protein